MAAQVLRSYASFPPCAPRIWDSVQDLWKKSELTNLFQNRVSLIKTIQKSGGRGAECGWWVGEWRMLRFCVASGRVKCCKWESEVLQVGGWWVGEWRMQRFCVARMNQQDESRRTNESSQRIKRSRCDSYTSVAKFEDARKNNQDESRMNHQDESRGLDVTHTQV